MLFAVLTSRALVPPDPFRRALGLFLVGFALTAFLGGTVHGFFPWRRIQEYPGEHCRKLDLSMTPGFSPSVYLGVLGLTGLSAYFPVVDIAKPVEGDTGE